MTAAMISKTTTTTMIHTQKGMPSEGVLSPFVFDCDGVVTSEGEGEGDGEGVSSGDGVGSSSGEGVGEGVGDKEGDAEGVDLQRV